MDPKPWWTSKTIWVNLITLAVLIIGVLVTQQRDLLPENWAKWLAAAAAVLNVILRFVTNQPLSSGSGTT